LQGTEGDAAGLMGLSVVFELAVALDFSSPYITLSSGNKIRRRRALFEVRNGSRFV